MRCGFWPLFQWCMCPCSSQSFANESTAGVSWRNITVTNKSNCLTYTVASLLVRTSPLVVITVVGLLDVFMVSNSAELKTFSLTTCTLSSRNQPQTLSSPALLLRHLGEPTFFCKREECSLVARFELVYKYLARSQALLWAHRSCLSVSSWDRSSNFIA